MENKLKEDLTSTSILSVLEAKDESFQKTYRRQKLQSRLITQERRVPKKTPNNLKGTLGGWSSPRALSSYHIFQRRKMMLPTTLLKYVIDPNFLNTLIFQSQHAEL